MRALLLLSALLTTPTTPPIAPLDLCGHIPDNGAPWYMEDGEGNPRPCPGDAPPPTPTPALPVRAWLPIVTR